MYVLVENQFCALGKYVKLRKILSEILGKFRNPLTVKVVQSLPSCCLSMRQISNIFRETYSRKPCLCKHWNFKQYAIKVIRMIEQQNHTKTQKDLCDIALEMASKYFLYKHFYFYFQQPLTNQASSSSHIYKMWQYYKTRIIFSLAHSTWQVSWCSIVIKS